MKIFKKLVMSLVILSLVSCGFHLRGREGDYKFPFKSTYLQCDTAVICANLRHTIQVENLTRLVSNKESAEATIVVGNEQTSRDANNFNGVGQISSYLLTYQITASIFDHKGEQMGMDIVVQNQMSMAYNNSLILSAAQQEDKTWGQIHANIINTLIRRIVYFKPVLASINAAESR